MVWKFEYKPGVIATAPGVTFWPISTFTCTIPQASVGALPA
jgi:hypothetical protein